MLGILNAEYNGGYDFASFQWFRNGEAIAGATEPYYYIESKLQEGDEYTVELRRAGDERALHTCAYTVPANNSQTPVAPRKIMQNGNIYIIVNGQVYNARGVLVNTIY